MKIGESQDTCAPGVRSDAKERRRMIRNCSGGAVARWTFVARSPPGTGNRGVAHCSVFAVRLRQFLYQSAEFRERKRFGEAGNVSGADKLLRPFADDIAGEEDEAIRRTRVVGPQTLKDLLTVKPRHLPVADDRVKLLLIDSAEAFFSLARR